MTLISNNQRHVSSKISIECMNQNDLLNDHGTDPLARVLCAVENNMVRTTANLDTSLGTTLVTLAGAEARSLAGVA